MPIKVGFFLMLMVGCGASSQNTPFQMTKQDELYEEKMAKQLQKMILAHPLEGLSDWVRPDTGPCRTGYPECRIGSSRDQAWYRRRKGHFQRNNGAHKGLHKVKARLWRMGGITKKLLTNRVLHTNVEKTYLGFLKRFSKLRKRVRHAVTIPESAFEKKTIEKHLRFIGDCKSSSITWPWNQKIDIWGWQSEMHEPLRFLIQKANHEYTYRDYRAQRASTARYHRIQSERKKMNAHFETCHQNGEYPECLLKMSMAAKKRKDRSRACTAVKGLYYAIGQFKAAKVSQSILLSAAAKWHNNARVNPTSIAVAKTGTCRIKGPEKTYSLEEALGKVGDVIPPITLSESDKSFEERKRIATIQLKVLRDLVEGRFVETYLDSYFKTIMEPSMPMAQEFYWPHIMNAAWTRSGPPVKLGTLFRERYKLQKQPRTRFRRATFELPFVLSSLTYTLLGVPIRGYKHATKIPFKIDGLGCAGRFIAVLEAYNRGFVKRFNKWLTKNERKLKRIAAKYTVQKKIRGVLESCADKHLLKTKRCDRLPKRERKTCNRLCSSSSLSSRQELTRKLVDLCVGDAYGPNKCVIPDAVRTKLPSKVLKRIESQCTRICKTKKALRRAWAEASWKKHKAEIRKCKRLKTRCDEVSEYLDKGGVKHRKAAERMMTNHWKSEAAESYRYNGKGGWRRYIKDQTKRKEDKAAKRLNAVLDELKRPARTFFPLSYRRCSKGCNDIHKACNRKCTEEAKSRPDLAKAVNMNTSRINFSLECNESCWSDRNSCRSKCRKLTVRRNFESSLWAKPKSWPPK